MKKIIAIDCDEVIANTLDSIFKFYCYTFNNLPIQRSDVTNFYRNELTKFSANEDYVKNYRNDFFASPEAMNIQPIEGAKEGLQKLSKMGYNLKIVTSRWQGTEKLTQDWVDQNFPDVFSDVIFGSATVDNHHLTNKADLMRHIGATCLVDDGLHNCLQVSAGGYETILFDNPWNQTETYIPGMKRVKNWQEIVEHFSL